MKKFLFLTLFCAGFIAANAQLSDGSIAPDFTVYEIDKANGSVLSNNPYNLYQCLDSDKVVYLDFFGTWCGPCWNYHNTNALESLYNQYGPEGTNEVMVFALETGSGTAADLQGTGSNTYGNWLNGTPYPVIPLGLSPNSTSLGNAYNIVYVPTVYMVCPCRVIFEVGQQTASDLYTAKSQLCPQFDGSLANNGMVVMLSNISNSYYCNATATPKVKLENVGEAALTSAVFSINLDGQTTSFSWNGNLAKYGIDEITLPQITTNQEGMHTYSVELVSVNGVADADTSWNTKEINFFVASEATTEDVVQDFTSGVSAPWFIDDDTYMGVYTNNALFFDAYNASSGTSASLYSPLMDISRFQVPTLKFDVAHRRYSTKTERLQVQATSNCGTSWSTLYNKAGANLATVTGSTSSQFVPTASQWRTERVDLSGVADKTNVALRFKFTSGYGNVVWIDNITIYEGLGVDENESEALAIYPNPTTGMLYVNASEPVREVQIFNLQGQLVRSQNGDVREISLFDLSDGVYMVKIFTENGSMTTQKIVKQ